MEENTGSFASDLFLRIDEEKRERIVSIAVEEFAAHGYAGANVNRIAESAGISIGALYKYFATKDDLFMYIVEISSARIAKFVHEIIDADIRFLSKLEKLMRLAQDYSRHDPSLVRLYNAFTSGADHERAALIAQSIESVTAKAYNALLEKAQQSGDIRKDIDAGILAFVLDNQLMMMQFSFACGYYMERYSLFLGERNARDDEHVIRGVMKAFEGMLGVR